MANHPAYCVVHCHVQPGPYGEKSGAKGIGMEILVRYKNEVFSIVQSCELDDLIASNAIVAFKRSSGWVDLSRDPIRGMGSADKYAGVERRGKAGKGLALVP
jgi:hypothetical protein